MASMRIIDGIPRRNRLDLFTPAERAITDAMKAVEDAGAHPLLTESVILLKAARDKVADFVDKEQRKEEVKQRIAKLTPEQRTNLVQSLMEWAYSEDTKEEYDAYAIQEQDRIMNLTPGELDAELRAAGFTDHDFAKLDRNIQEARQSIRERFGETP